jgi:hypothetical protein
MVEARQCVHDGRRCLLLVRDALGSDDKGDDWLILQRRASLGQNAEQRSDTLRRADNEQISGSNEHTYLGLTVQTTVEALDTSFGRPSRPPTPCWQESKIFRIRGNAPITKASSHGSSRILESHVDRYSDIDIAQHPYKGLGTGLLNTFSTCAQPQRS